MRVKDLCLSLASTAFQQCDLYIENGIKLSLFNLLLKGLNGIRSINDLGQRLAYVKNW